jgi:hypothetical protein
VEFVDEIGAYKDKYGTENNGPQNTPEKNFMVVGFINPKVFQDKQDNKDIIYRKGIFGKVSRKVLHCPYCTALIIDINKVSKKGRYGYPKNRLIECRTRGNFMSLFVK